MIGGLRARACARWCHVVVQWFTVMDTAFVVGSVLEPFLLVLQYIDKRAVAGYDLYYVSALEYLLFVYSNRFLISTLVPLFREVSRHLGQRRSSKGRGR